MTTTAFNKKIRASLNKIPNISRLTSTTALSDVMPLLPLVIYNSK